MSKRAPKDERPDPSEMTWEQAMAELEAINLQIEQGEIGLEDSLAAYKRGVSLTKRCHAILDTAEQELKKIKPGGRGEETHRLGNPESAN